jgi:hypothetical protein
MPPFAPEFYTEWSARASRSVAQRKFCTVQYLPELSVAKPHVTLLLQLGELDLND